MSASTGRLRRLVATPWVVMPVVAALGFGTWATFLHDDASPTSTDDPAATEQVVDVTTGSLARTISAEGTVEHAESEDLAFTSAGTVTAVDVVAGQAVTAGQVLATLDATDLTADVADAEAALAEAQATLEDDTDDDASDAQLDADAASVTAATDDLTAAQEALADAQLVAPFDGTVAIVDLTVGEQLTSGGAGATSPTGSGSGSGQSAGDLGSSQPTGGTDSGTGTTAQIQVVSAGHFTVELGLDATDVAEVAVGQAATVALATTSDDTTGGFGAFPGGGPPGLVVSGDGAPTAQAGPTDANDDTAAADPQLVAGTGSATGTVTEVAEVADASSGVATYAVTVAFDDASGDYNAGATVSVDITVGDTGEVVLVPAFAVTTADDGTSTVVVRDADGHDETRTITTGGSSGLQLEVTSGLEVGEQVVVQRPGGGPVAGGAGGPGTGAATAPASP